MTTRARRCAHIPTPRGRFIPPTGPASRMLAGFDTTGNPHNPLYDDALAVERNRSLRRSRAWTFVSMHPDADLIDSYPTVVPNSFPTPAVAPIASAPQNATRAAPTAAGAPPTRAASAPSTTRQ